MSEVPDVAGLEKGVRRLEVELTRTRGHGVRLGRSLYAAINRDLQDALRRARRAESRAERAEKRATRAERRAERAERELAELRTSTTWKVGRAVVALPATAKRAVTRARDER